MEGDTNAVFRIPDTVAELPKFGGHLILFLDFDGVLHRDDDRFDNPFGFMDNFCEVIRDVDERNALSIVISSSWRTTHSLDEMVIHFPMDVALRIIGVTPDLAAGDFHMPGIRQREIEAWMAASAPHAPWLAVDDRADGFDPGCPHLFHIPWTDTQLEADIRAAAQPLSEAQTVALRTRAWQNRSVGLNEEVSEQLRTRLLAMLRPGQTPSFTGATAATVSATRVGST